MVDDSASAAPPDASAAHAAPPRWRAEPRTDVPIALLVSVFVVAACGLVYELIAGATASYLLGDSVLQFSTVIGAYLFAMGIGSWLSRHLLRDLAGHFLRIELMIGLIGGFMAIALYLLHAYAPAAFRPVLYGLIFVIGALVGLEIPLVMRLLRQHYALKDLVSQVLTFDYLGALLVAVAFPLLLVPQLGMIRTGLFFGLANAIVAAWACWLFRERLIRPWAHGAATLASIAALGAGFAAADHITTFAEEGLYLHRIVYAESTPFQRIVVTQGQGDLRLYLNRNLQFSSRDEHRYHEALVHPVMLAHPAPRRVLILGGGDGLAAREVLRHPAVERITLVDLDPRMTTLFATLPALAALNGGALSSPKVTIVNDDAFTWLEHAQDLFDIAIVDLPDPTNFSLGKLYTTSFYGLLASRVAASGFAVIQTTSPLYARRSFWTVAETLEAAGWRSYPYHTTVPSFGVWGYIAAARRPLPLDAAVAALAAHPERAPRFLTPALLPSLFEFPIDMQRVPAAVNRLHDQVLVHTYEADWGKAPEH
ncbi:MAG: polyamine aminopropyltransferase [Lautropia sp.]